MLHLCPHACAHTGTCTPCAHTEHAMCTVTITNGPMWKSHVILIDCVHKEHPALSAGIQKTPLMLEAQESRRGLEMVPCPSCSIIAVAVAISETVEF